MSTSASWWAAKLSGQAPPPSLLPSGPREMAVRPTADVPPTTKAQSARQTDYCPSCNSDNYFRPLPQSGLRCYDCGYPLVQSGTGVSSIKSQGKTKPARQVPTAGFQPGTIVGHIG